jgi:CRISPR-associated endonuclease/helicase Cas3
LSQDEKDSDEQLAGRINRNVLKEKSKLFLFNKDEASRIYGKDLRYEFTQKMDLTTKKEILENKNFNKLYDLVKEKINSDNKKQFTENFSDYKSKIDNLNFYEIDEDFQLINNETTSFFVPLCVPIIWKGFEDDPNFSKNEIDFLVDNRQMNKKSTVIDGEKVWELYKSIIENRNNDFVQQAINIKIINGIMSKFIFSTFSNKNLIEKMKRYCDYDEDKSNFKIYGYYYLNRYEGIYTLEGGLDESKLDSDFII